MSKCLCCGREMKTDVCQYCGWVEVEALDNAGLENVKNLAQEHKNKVVSDITDICLQASEYDDNTYAFKGYKNIFIANGKDCYNRFADAATTFKGVDLAEILAKTRKITLLYKFEGKQRQVSIQMNLPKTADDWYFGVKLNEDLTLSVRTGSRAVNATASDIALNLK